jgi:hypothetical protein
MSAAAPRLRLWTREEYYQMAVGRPYGYGYRSNIRYFATDHISPFAVPQGTVSVVDLLP